MKKILGAANDAFNTVVNYVKIHLEAVKEVENFGLGNAQKAGFGKRETEIDWRFLLMMFQMQLEMV